MRKIVFSVADGAGVGVEGNELGNFGDVDETIVELLELACVLVAV